MLSLLVALLLAVVLLAAVTGPYPLPPATVARAVVLRLAGATPEPGSPAATVLFGVRLPRIGAALLDEGG